MTQSSRVLAEELRQGHAFSHKPSNIRPRVQFMSVLVTIPQEFYRTDFPTNLPQADTQAVNLRQFVIGIMLRVICNWYISKPYYLGCRSGRPIPGTVFSNFPKRNYFLCDPGFFMIPSASLFRDSAFSSSHNLSNCSFWP